MGRESTDILQNIQKTNDYLSPTTGGDYGMDNRKANSRERNGNSISNQAADEQNVYDLDTYKNRVVSPAQLQQQMMMRPTVAPKELQEVQRHATIQNILKNKNNRKP